MKNVLLLLCAFLGLSGCHAAQDGDTIDNSTVSVFDVRRFMGKWYEIARYDHRFEKGMTHVAATYSLQENGSIKVNAARKSKVDDNTAKMQSIKQLGV